MDIGIGLPNAVRGVDRAGIIDWARRAEQAGSSYLAALEQAGADETICFPASPDPGQVELLARAVGL